MLLSLTSIATIELFAFSNFLSAPFRSRNFRRVFESRAQYRNFLFTGNCCFKSACLGSIYSSTYLYLCKEQFCGTFTIKTLVNVLHPNFILIV